MTELSKFLTFLSDEEREQVLSKFGEIFDASPNQDELVSTLVSPLKVTVELSRAYSGGGIEKALERSIELSGVDLSSAPSASPVSDEGAGGNIYSSMDGAVKSAFEEAEAEAAHSAEAPAAGGEVRPASVENSSEKAENPDGDKKEARPDKAGRDKKPEETEEVSPPAEMQAPENDLAPDKTADTEDAPISVPAAPIVSDVVFENVPADITAEAAAPAQKPEYRVRPFALIPFIILFVPLGLIGIAVFICVGAVLLAAAAAAVACGIMAVSLAFSGIAIFADIIMTIGAALVCFAVGIVFLWFGIWFIIWSIGGLVRGILRLGRKWCYKEVSAG